MFKLIIHHLFCFELVFCNYPLFKVASVFYNPYQYETALFRRSKGPNCSKYVKQRNRYPLLHLLPHENSWKIVAILERDPFCYEIEFQSWNCLRYFNLNSLDLCNTTNGYEIDGGEALIMNGDNCQNRLKKLVENSTEDEYVFFSTKCTGRYSVCNFAFSKDINIKKSDNSSLTVYHRNCIGKDKLKTIEVCSEFNNKEKNDTGENENQTLIFGIIGSSAVVLVGIATLIIVFCVKSRGMMCFKKESQEIIVHQNELYGNLSNQDYFSERYDTDIVDRNQYYEEEYEA